MARILFCSLRGVPVIGFVNTGRADIGNILKGRARHHAANTPASAASPDPTLVEGSRHAAERQARRAGPDYG
jgi:hypothetical protein